MPAGKKEAYNRNQGVGILFRGLLRWNRQEPSSWRKRDLGSKRQQYCYLFTFELSVHDQSQKGDGTIKAFSLTLPNVLPSVFPSPEFSCPSFTLFSLDGHSELLVCLHRLFIPPPFRHLRPASSVYLSTPVLPHAATPLPNDSDQW